MTLIIGLTGGIGSGKSTVSAFFEQLSITIVDADIVAREVVAKGQSALHDIAAHFGCEILINGELNRALLREKIFQDNREREWLNALLHPLIHERIINALNAAQGAYVLLEAPLLFENGLDQLTDYNIVVDIEKEVQIQRASSRDGVSVESIKAIIKKQISRAERLRKADFIIDNSHLSRDTLRTNVQALDQQLRSLANKP